MMKGGRTMQHEQSNGSAKGTLQRIIDYSAGRDPDTQEEPQEQRDVYALRVYRVEAGENVYLRMLSDSYGGCFTHYYQKRSLYCPGDVCKCAVHNNPQCWTWKGYCAAELYDDKKALWLPVVFEITERLEQDFRHRFKRGQVWNVFRYAIKKSGEPVMGTLHETLDPRTLQKPFDLQPVLRMLYHWNGVIILDKKNPLPDRVLVAPTKGDAPQALQLTGDKQADDEQRERDQRSFEERAKEFSAKRRKAK